MNENLIKTIIVDDDIEMLKGLTHYIPWESYGFTIVSTFENAASTIKYVRNNPVDLIISDISMPGISGLDMIKQLQQENFSFYSVILTCYEDFSYAKKAISLGTSEYIIKDTLTKKELITLLQNVKKIREETINKEKVLKRAKRLEFSNKRVMINDFYNKMIHCENPKTFKEKAEDLHLPFPVFEPSSIFIMSSILDYSQSKSTYHLDKEEEHTEAINTLFDDIFTKDRENSMFWINKTTQGIIFYGDTSNLKQTLRHYAKEVYEKLNISLAFTLAPAKKEIDTLQKAYEKALTLRDEFFIEGRASIVQIVKEKKELDVPSIVETYKKQFLSEGKTIDLTTIETLSNSLFLRLSSHRYQVQQIKEVVQHLYVEIASHYARNSIMNTFPLMNVNTINGLHLQFNNSLKDVYQSLAEQDGHRYRKEIQDAITYIQDHPQTIVSLELIAERENMVPNYFSRLFKKEVGCSFTDFNIGQRMEKANTLLETTDDSNEQIAEAIGIESVTYFYRIFKKWKGKTPGQVRRESRQ